MKIQVLGPGCPRCKELARLTEEALRNLGLDSPVEKVTDLRQMGQFGIVATPALVVDGVVKVSGRVPSSSELMQLLIDQVAK